MKCISKISAVLLTVFVILLLCSGCTEHLPELSPTYTYTPRAVGVVAYRDFCLDNFVITKSRSAVYDRTTGEVKFGFCEDPECDGSCPLETGSPRITGISQGRLYFNTLERTPYYGYIDIVTGEVVYLLSIDYEEMLPMRPMFVDGGWVYLTRKHLKEGGNPENSDDYIAHLSRIPEDGGKEEVIYAMRENAESLMLIVDGVMYTWYQSKIWRTDLEVWEPMIVHDLETSEINHVGECCYLDGNLYFNTIHANGDKYIVRMDAISGEWSYIVDVDVTNYWITNDAIYFSPYEHRLLSDPERYPEGSDEAHYADFSATLYACDLDGENVRAVFTDTSGVLGVGNNSTVVDDIYYGWINHFDQKKNAWGEVYFAELHFDTGEIIPATVVD